MSAGTVLLVDDDKAILRTLTDILGLRGYEVETAEKGGAAIARMIDNQSPPLVAIVDVGLPDVSGLEVAERVKDRGGITQVVILTGDASVQSAVGALRASSVDYLVKPVDPAQLFETIERAIERALRKSAETELEAERRRRADILDASPVGFVVRNASGDMEYLNPVGAEVLGLDDEELHGDHRKHVEQWLRSLADGWSGNETQDFRYRHPDGDERVLACRMRPLSGSAAGSHGTLVAFTDVTETRRIEDQLRQTQKLEAIGRLAGGVAHDFNNLLTVILANAEFVQSELPEDSPYGPDLEAIRNAAVQAADVASQLLTFSRRDPGRVEAVNLNEIVAELKSLLARTIEQDFLIEDELDASLPRVEANPGQLRQVIMNLAMNARDAMGESGTLTFRTGSRRTGDLSSEVDTDPDVSWVYLDVSDTGHGMDAETQSRVFEPFFTTKVEGKGTGLGLATVYGIVSQMGGVIEIDSTVGVGTTFRVNLPASSDKLPSAAATDEAQAAERGSTILVVDDEERVRTLLRRILIRDGHRVLEASHGREALEIASQHDGPIDLVMTDHQMPGLPPTVYLPALLEGRPETAVTVVTGSATPERVTRPLQNLGRPIGFLSKPFDARSVGEVLSTMLPSRDEDPGS